MQHFQPCSSQFDKEDLYPTTSIWILHRVNVETIIFFSILFFCQMPIPLKVEWPRQNDLQSSISQLCLCPSFHATLLSPSCTPNCPLAWLWPSDLARKESSAQYSNKHRLIPKPDGLYILNTKARRFRHPRYQSSTVYTTLIPELDGLYILDTKARRSIQPSIQDIHCFPPKPYRKTPDSH